MILSEHKQGTDEWLAERIGLPTASKFDMVVTSKGEPSKQQQKYIYQLAGEIVTGRKEDTYCNEAMQRGIELEDEARTLYELVTGDEVEQVGLAWKTENKAVGASSDGLVGDDGMIEIKCPKMVTHVEYLVKGVLPTKYVPQVQGQMYVLDRKWCDFISYYPSMELLKVRVMRDDEFIKKLDCEITVLLAEINKVLEKIKK